MHFLTDVLFKIILLSRFCFELNIINDYTNKQFYRLDVKTNGPQYY